MTTSREPLGVPGEVLMEVRGLTPSAAVELFLSIAPERYDPGFHPAERSQPSGD